MKRRIIINIESDITDERAIEIVASVVAMGRISESAGRAHYCHISTTRDDLTVQSFKRTDTTDTFTIWK